MISLYGIKDSVLQQLQEVFQWGIRLLNGLLVIVCETGITMLLCSISPAGKALKNYVNTVTL